MADAIPEVRQGRLAQMDEAVEKLAGRELRPADAVPDHPDPAWVVFPERHAWNVLAKRWAQRHAAEAPCKPDAGRFAA
jgi:hypothetical protein